MSVIDLATYAYNLQLSDKSFTSGMLNAETRTEKFKGKLDGLTSFLKTSVVAGLASVGVALGGMAIASVKSADEFQKSMNGLQASTGATNQEMEGLEQSVKNIYAQKLGENFEDVAQSMALVKQVTGETGDELEKTTKNALLLRDTFEFDVNESINSANSLMKNFGITSDQAYVLIAQGAQNGANKNGDLLDTLNEYSPAFKALGFSAEEFTDILISGAENGAFSIDKIGDAIKEFGIRSKDMSSGTMEAFDALGLNAEQMSTDFANGGEKAQAAFQTVISSLENIEDPLERNQIGVALFGTMFEDLEASAILSLGNVNSIADSTANTLEQINKVKYNSFGEAIEGIKRNLQTGLLLPIGQQILPVLNQFAGWINSNMPQIQNTIEGALTAIGTVFNLVSDIIKTLIFILQEMYNQNKTVFDGVKNVIVSVLNFVITFIKATLALIRGDWSGFNQQMENLTRNFWELIKNIFKLALAFLDSLLGGAISKFLSHGRNIMTGLWDGFRGIWTSVREWFSNSFNGLSEWFGGLNKTFFNIGGNILTSVFDGLKSVWTKLSDWITEKVNWIKDKLSAWTSAQKKMSSGGSSSVKVPSYDIGTKYVPFDQVALIHQGEAVVPAQYNPWNPANQMSNGKNSNGITPNTVTNNFTIQEVRTNDARKLLSNLQRLVNS